MLRIDRLQVAYGPVPALHGISLHVEQGETVAVVGPNGAGKSTLLLTIAGALSPTGGAIYFENQPIVSHAPENIARLGIALVPEGRNIFTQLTVEENLRLGTQMRKDRARIERDFESMLELFPILGERLSSPGGKLSGGEQQQLAIARALMTQARLLLLDEPSLGLAPMLVDTVYRVLHQLRGQGITLLLIEQNTHRALANSDRIYVLRQGQFALQGKSAELDDKAIEKAYFGYA